MVVWLLFLCSFCSSCNVEKACRCFPCLSSVPRQSGPRREMQENVKRLKHRHNEEEAGASSRRATMESSSEPSADWARLWSAAVRGDQVRASLLLASFFFPPTDFCCASFVRVRCCSGCRPRNHSHSLSSKNIFVIAKGPRAERSQLALHTYA